MSLKTLIIFVIGFTFSQHSFGLDTSREFQDEMKLDTTPIIELEIGESERQMVAVVQYPNGCYNPFHSFKSTKGNTLVLVHVAEFEAEALCTRALQFVEVKYNIKNLDAGLYEVIDGNDGERIAWLEKEESGARLDIQ